MNTLADPNFSLINYQEDLSRMKGMDDIGISRYLLGMKEYRRDELLDYVLTNGVDESGCINPHFSLHVIYGIVNLYDNNLNFTMIPRQKRKSVPES